MTSLIRNSQMLGGHYSNLNYNFKQLHEKLLITGLTIFEISIFAWHRGLLYSKLRALLHH